MTITYEITDTVLPGQFTAVVRGELPPARLPAWLGDTYRRVGEYLGRNGMVPAGPPFARFSFLGGVVVVEAGFPVPREVAGDGTVEPSALPDGPAAVTTHVGRYEDLEHAYTAVTRWLRASDRTPAGPHWEVYYSDPRADPDPAHWRTDVVVPYRHR